jgi:hypothetical protein
MQKRACTVARLLIHFVEIGGCAAHLTFISMAAITVDWYDDIDGKIQLVRNVFFKTALHGVHARSQT